MTKYLLFAACLSTSLAAGIIPANPSHDQQGKEPAKRLVPTSQYTTQSIEGWTVRVNKTLLGEQAELGSKALRLLETKLYEIRRVVPERACAELQKVPIWLGIDDGSAPCAEYHVSKDWLRENGFNPEKAKAVEIGNATRFLRWTIDQPTMLLHELAHAYHDQVLTFDHAEVLAAYKAAKERKNYESVLRFSGKMERAYALVNHHEYFAEATEAYFGTNDFYPFVRAELKEHDPEIFRILEDVWGVTAGNRSLVVPPSSGIALPSSGGIAALPPESGTTNDTLQLPPFKGVLPPETQQAPAPPNKAVEHLKLPDGFRATLFAAEPDVRQPIAFAIDDRGRLWVVECYSYPNWATEGNDRIIILEDQNGDGRFDKRTVFWDKGANFAGIELGFGGVWVAATPYLLFIPDKDGDDRPDGQPIVMLDGWDIKARHNVFNCLKWGPDGWLYGCNGILSNSRVGRPGAPDAERVALNCGVWRFHPTRHTFEAVAHGTTNPWGMDFDEHGEMFITNCVIPHLFHVVPGAHFQRMFGQDINPYSYALLESVADHIHWGGGDWTSSRGGQGKHSEAGGGHAHAGAMVYLGDNWPDEYRNSVFMCNIHGSRINRDLLARRGSTYVATHGKDFLFSRDQWFRGLEMKYGPDGGVYLTDWSDAGECHDYDQFHGAHLDSGRIFKITFGQPKPARVNLAKLANDELVQMQLHKNDWFVQHSRRILQERAAAGDDMAKVHESLRDILDHNPDVTRKLRALWTLHATGGLPTESLAKLLEHESEYMRGWSVRLLTDAPGPLPDSRDHNILARFVAMAAQDPSPYVRLRLAAALQRIPPQQRFTIAAGLVKHPEDAADPYLPLMTWYAVEPLMAVDRSSAIALAAQSQIPHVRRFLARRGVVSDASNPDVRRDEERSGLTATLSLLRKGNDPAVQVDLVRGVRDGLQGRRDLVAPAGWPETFEKLLAVTAASGEQAAVAGQVREQALLLALMFGDARAVSILEQTMLNRRAAADERQRAITALVENRTAGLAPKLQGLLDDEPVRGAALRALSASNDAATPRLILERFAKLSPAEREDAVATLASRPVFAVALLDAVGSGVVARSDVSVFVARQLAAFRNQEIDQKLAAVWGTLRPTAGEKTALALKYKSQLNAESLRRADASNGRLVFQKHCAQCHRLFGEGGDVGPDLTGANRDNLDYILENALDPNAVVPREYRLTVIATKDGRVLSGLIREQSTAAIVLQTANDRVVLSRDDVEEIKESTNSMMPEGLFDKMSMEELRDLVAHLARKAPSRLDAK
jgi:putative membrane-bound dehydrogenase-like protein